MSSIVLGLSGALLHDAAAALYVDGELVAAAEEERFVRDKHASNRVPYEAARFCLEFAGLKPEDVAAVAIPFAPEDFGFGARWRFARRHAYAPGQVLQALLQGDARYHACRNRIGWCLDQLGFDSRTVEVVPVARQLAHAAGAYHCSGFREPAAIMVIDGQGEYASGFFAYGENGRIHAIDTCYVPDSLGALYGAFTEYLGFERADGEYKLMGMAAYGDAEKYDFSRLARVENGELVVNTDYVNVLGHRRYERDGRRFGFSRRLVDWLGPPRDDDAAEEPYVHYAAAVQRLFEDLALQMMEHHLGAILRETGRLALAGDGALNVKLNRRILAGGNVKELYVQPAAGEAGAAAGAAAYVSARRGTQVRGLEHVYLGPRYTNEDVVAACVRHPAKPQWRSIADVPQTVARLLADGHPVAWFQGRMEFGPRALGGRSILGCASVPGIADRINEQIKFRERWRPFCPSMLDTVAPRMLKSTHPAPFMTLAFDVEHAWRERVPEVVHRDGTARAHVLRREWHPRFYELLLELEKLTGNGVVLNTSLNRRGEPIVCSPADALEMFFACGLRYLVMEDVLVVKGDPLA